MKWFESKHICVFRLPKTKFKNRKDGADIPRKLSVEISPLRFESVKKINIFPFTSQL